MMHIINSVCLFFSTHAIAIAGVGMAVLLLMKPEDKR